jgi:catechol 2,3-dioxygenase-like lactoylglutathione lyase family enzyme
MLRRIDMVAVYVRDWEHQLAWYQEQLGFAAVHLEHHHRFAVLALPGGGPTLHLVGDDTRPEGSRNRCVPNVVVEDFDATLGELRARGVRILEVEDDTDDGYRLARLADPEGNELNIYTVST